MQPGARENPRRFDSFDYDNDNDNENENENDANRTP